MKKGVGRLTPIQKRRAMTWMRRGFTAHQARMFAEFPLARHYMVAFYRNLQNTPNFRALSDQDLWALWRRGYDLSVSLGKYDDPKQRRYPSGKPHRKISPDGSVDRSHARAYERGRRSSMRVSRPQISDAEQIELQKAQLRSVIKSLGNYPERKAQMEEQLKRLENLGG